jgi:hypothetical protein
LSADNRPLRAFEQTLQPRRENCAIATRALQSEAQYRCANSDEGLQRELRESRPRIRRHRLAMPRSQPVIHRRGGAVFSLGA